MSKGYSIIDKSVWTMLNKHKITRAQRELFIYILSNFYNTKKHTAWPSQRRLAEGLGRSRRSIRRDIKALILVGLLIKTPHDFKCNDSYQFPTINEHNNILTGRISGTKPGAYGATTNTSTNIKSDVPRLAQDSSLKNVHDLVDKEEKDRPSDTALSGKGADVVCQEKVKEESQVTIDLVNEDNMECKHPISPLTEIFPKRECPNLDRSSNLEKARERDLPPTGALPPSATNPYLDVDEFTLNRMYESLSNRIERNGVSDSQLHLLKTRLINVISVMDIKDFSIPIHDINGESIVDVSDLSVIAN